MKNKVFTKCLLCVAFALLASCSSVRNTAINYQENSEGYEYSDLRGRLAILEFVENFRMAYNRKDIALLATIYSNDASIYNPEKGTKQTKKKYFNYLRSYFLKNDIIHLTFDDIEIIHHPSYDNIFEVKLKQGWNSSKYSGADWLFLMIAFKDGVNMQILQCIWQPETFNEH